MRAGKGKQRLDQVQISPFEIRLASPPTTPLLESYGSSESLRPPPLPHRTSSDSTTTPARHSASTYLPTSGPMTRRSQSLGNLQVVGMPRSASTSSSTDGSVYSRSGSLISSLSSAATSSHSLNDAVSRPPLPPMPIEHQTQRSSSQPEEGVRKLKFPSAFNFVERPDIDEDDVKFGAAENAASVPIPLLTPVRHLSTVLQPPRRSNTSPAPSSSSEMVSPPRRSESLYRPSMDSYRPSSSASRGGDSKQDKKKLAAQAFEDLLESNATRKLNLTPAGLASSSIG